MNTKPGDLIVYTNVDGTEETLEAVACTHPLMCSGCVGEGTYKPNGLSVCRHLPNCGGIIWKEAVS